MKSNSEIWKDIPELNGYQASNFGNIRSLNYNRTKKIKQLSKYDNNKGYLGVKITKNGVGRRYLVHILVMWAFYGRNDKLEINHKDGNKKNNEIIKKYSFIKEAENYGFSHSKIVLCCQGKRNTHKGYQWRYADEQL